MYSFGNKKEILELAIRTLCDDVPKRADAAVIFGEIAVDKKSLIREAKSLWFDGKVNYIAVSRQVGAKIGEFLVPGFKEVKNDLIEMNIPKDRIIGFSLYPNLPPCTDAEAIGLISFASQKKWQSVFLIGPPVHQFRIFVSVASAIIKSGSQLKAWNRLCDTRGWNEVIAHRGQNKVIAHSYKIPKDKRWNIIQIELEKIEKYHQKGDHLSAKKILEYMNNRYEKTT